MTMHVSLPPELEGFIESKMASGLYSDATAVIGDAIRLMQAEEVRIAAWQAAIRLGSGQLDRGEAIAYSPETLNDITRSAIAALYSGEPIDADVAP